MKIKLTLICIIFIKMVICRNETIECENGGHEYGNVCKCQLGYSGSKCETIKCENAGRISNYTNTCSCNDDWSGVKCLMCENDDACEDGMGCEKNARIKTVKNIVAQCKVLDVDLGKTFGEIVEVLSTNTTTISIYGWKMTLLNKLEPTIFCTLSNCNVTNEHRMNEGHEVDVVRCNHTVCNCVGSKSNIGVCNIYIRNIVNGVNGGAKFTCINDRGKSVKCNAEFSNLSWKTSLECKSSACVDLLEPGRTIKNNTNNFGDWLVTTTERWKWYWITYCILGLIIFVLIILAILIDCCKSSIKRYEKKSYQDIKISLKMVNISCFVSRLPGLLSYIPYTPNSFRKYIIKDLSFTVETKEGGGHLHLINGNSGDGKTTLLRIISRVLERGNSSGTVLLNGIPISKTNANRFLTVAYDDEIFSPELTVKEILLLTANLKGIENPNYEIDSILSTLCISEKCNVKLGPHNSHNISGGEYKRLIIANAMISKPRILIIDEPTNRLDSLMSDKVIAMLREYAKKNLVIVVAHSIGSFCYQMFDGVTIISGEFISQSGSREEVDKNINSMLEDGGVERGEDAYDNIRRFMQMKRFPGVFVSKKSNLLSKSEDDTMLVNEGNTDSQTIELDDKEVELNDNEVDIIELASTLEKEESSIKNSIKFKSVYSTSFATQFKVLLMRDFKLLLRKIEVLWLQLVVYILCAIFISIYSHNLSNDIPGVQTRIGVIAAMGLIISMSSVGSVWRIQTEYEQMVKESDSGLYHPWIYLTSKLITDFFVLRALPTITFCCIIYWSMGVMADDWWIYIYKYIIMCSVFTVMSFISSTICIAIYFIFQNPIIFTVIINVVLLVLSLMNGVFINKETIHGPIKLTYSINFIKFATEALYVNEFLHSTVIINPKEFSAFNISIPVEGKFYLNQMGLDSTAMEFDFFALTAFFSGYVLVLYPLISLILWIRRKR